MNNFTFHIPTDIRFGKDQIQCLPEELAKYGKKVLLVYGGGSIKRSGLYDKIRELLKDFEVSELPGIEPNPKLTSVEKGTAICKEKGIQVIVAVPSMHLNISQHQPVMMASPGIWLRTEVLWQERCLLQWFLQYVLPVLK